MQTLLDTFALGSGMKSALSKGAFMAAMIGFSVAGSFACKKASTLTDLTTFYFGLGAAAWTLSAACFVALLKTGPLGVFGPLAAVLQLAVVMAVSAAFLNETYSMAQWVATGVAVSAMGVSMALST